MTKLTEKIVHLTLSAIDTRTEMKTTQSEIKDLKEQDERLLQEITAIKENMREILMIDGGWSDFGDWSECSAECGGGTKKRDRTCTNPAPEHGGTECQEDGSENQECNTHNCPINGGWSDFGDWSECSAEFNGFTQARVRSCTNPSPQDGGAECKGTTKESQECYILNILCDDELSLFVDGTEKRVPGDDKWYRAWNEVVNLNIPSTTHVIAVNCVDLGGSYGIIGSVQDARGNDIMVTDTSWRCSNVWESGWEGSDFTEGDNWNQATDNRDGTLTRKNGLDDWTNVPVSSRRPIWTSSSAYTSVYCRKTMG